MDECILKAERLTEKIESLTLVDDLNVAIKDRKSSASSGPAARMATSIKMTVGLLQPSGRRVQFDGVETQ
jgi:ABC-type lipopolysaccharide export system ATPase subunit